MQLQVHSHEYSLAIGLTVLQAFHYHHGFKARLRITASCHRHVLSCNLSMASSHGCSVCWTGTTLLCEWLQAIVLATTSWVGGKNNFLGIIYIIFGVLALVVALAFLLTYQMGMMKRRRFGDPSYLSWNRHANVISR